MNSDLEKKIETLSEQIHHLYCEQYEKDHGEPYWTQGDYSKLEERVKEYDRNIARFIFEREASWREEMAKKVEELRPSNEKGYTVSFHNARTMAAALLRSTKDEPQV